MAKAPAASRLTILVDFDYLDRPEIAELADKGHTILQAPAGADIILSRSAHYFTPEMFDDGLIEVAIKAARAKRRGK